MHCIHCGNPANDNSRFCQECGKPIPVEINEKSGKSPIIAIILSMLIVGLGQFYNGQTIKGIFMLALGIVFALLSAGILWFVVALWSAVDAYNYAMKRR
jgi:TM2 domain-containing membrane protein YozV